MTAQARVPDSPRRKAGPITVRCARQQVTGTMIGTYRASECFAPSIPDADRETVLAPAARRDPSIARRTAIVD